jgi:putative SOS response-associated peptidase YedK
MIMTEANDFISSIHHRMPALIEEEWLDLYLSGVDLGLGPADRPLEAKAVPSPLKKPPTDHQGELF